MQHIKSPEQPIRPKEGNPVRAKVLRLMAEGRQTEAEGLLSRYADVLEQAKAAHDSMIQIFVEKECDGN